MDKGPRKGGTFGTGQEEIDATVEIGGTLEIILVNDQAFFSGYEEIILDNLFCVQTMGV